jgi:multisubunit Na+/H+ antiporter MnhB subunit
MISTIVSIILVFLVYLWYKKQSLRGDPSEGFACLVLIGIIGLAIIFNIIYWVIKISLSLLIG